MEWENVCEKPRHVTYCYFVGHGRYVKSSLIDQGFDTSKDSRMFQCPPGLLCLALV